MPKNNATNNIFLNQPVTQTATNYTALATDVIIEVTNTSAPRTITLPAPSSAASTSNVGKFYVIKDTSGGAGTNNISIVPASGTIDGAANSSIQTNYGALQVFSDGTNYYLQGLWVNPSNYNPGVWFPYPSMTVNGKTFPAGTMPVTATTNPTKGTGGSEAAYYIQLGKLLVISWQYSQTTPGTSGSGNYIFSVPQGFTINTAIALPYSAAPSGYPYSMGCGMANVASNTSCSMNANAFNSTGFYLIPNAAYNTLVSANYFAYSLSGAYIMGITLFVPIN